MSMLSTQKISHTSSLSKIIATGTIGAGLIIGTISFLKNNNLGKYLGGTLGAVGTLTLAVEEAFGVEPKEEKSKQPVLTTLDQITLQRNILQETHLEESLSLGEIYSKAYEGEFPFDEVEKLILENELDYLERELWTEEEEKNWDKLKDVLPEENHDVQAIEPLKIETPINSQDESEPDDFHEINLDEYLSSAGIGPNKEPSSNLEPEPVCLGEDCLVQTKIDLPTKRDLIINPVRSLIKSSVNFLYKLVRMG